MSEWKSGDSLVKIPEEYRTVIMRERVPCIRRRCRGGNLRWEIVEFHSWWQGGKDQPDWRFKLEPCFHTTAGSWSAETRGDEVLVASTSHRAKGAGHGAHSHIALNIADLGTKQLTRSRRAFLMFLLGMVYYDTRSTYRSARLNSKITCNGSTWPRA